MLLLLLERESKKQGKQRKKLCLDGTQGTLVSLLASHEGCGTRLQGSYGSRYVRWDGRPRHLPQNISLLSTPLRTASLKHTVFVQTYCEISCSFQQRHIHLSSNMLFAIHVCTVYSVVILVKWGQSQVVI
jgi:hypothetical protein